jgi:hypothetical protein
MFLQGIEDDDVQFTFVAALLALSDKNVSAEIIALKFG